MLGHFSGKRPVKWPFFLGDKGTVIDSVSAALRFPWKTFHWIIDRTSAALRLREGQTFILAEVVLLLRNQAENSFDAASQQDQSTVGELVPQVLSPPPCQLPPELEAPLASSASCLDCPSPPIATSAEQDAEACSPLPFPLFRSYRRMVVSMYYVVRENFFFSRSWLHTLPSSSLSVR